MDLTGTFNVTPMAIPHLKKERIAAVGAAIDAAPAAQVLVCSGGVSAGMDVVWPSAADAVTGGRKPST